jgi:hypothetical protein
MWKLYGFVVLLLLASGFLINSAVEEYDYAQVDARGEVIEATVVGHGTRGLSSTGYVITYTYTYEGNTYKSNRLVSWKLFSDKVDGAKIKIKVDPKIPQHSVIPGNKAERSLIAFGRTDPFYVQTPWYVHFAVAVALLAFAVVLLIIALRKQLRNGGRGDQKQLRNGGRGDEIGRGESSAGETNGDRSGSEGRGSVSRRGESDDGGRGSTSRLDESGGGQKNEEKLNGDDSTPEPDTDPED